MPKPQIGDEVILDNGSTVFVKQVAEFDNIFEFDNGAGWSGWTTENLIAWNITEANWVALDSDLMQDYT